MLNAIRDLLNSRGYAVNDRAYELIGACDDWYRGRATDAHRRVTVGGERYEMERMGFGKRAAADDANLCEVVEIEAGSGAQAEFVCGVLARNRFDTQYRRQLELVSAEGTAACYARLEDARVYSDGTLRGGRIRLNYVDALGFLPLTVVNGEVLEAGFVGEDRIGGERVTTLVLCTVADGAYQYETRAYGERGQEKPERRSVARLGAVKPFAVLRTAQVNGIEGMQGFGYPKLLGAIPILKGLDAAYTALMGDLDSAEKITLVNEALCRFDGEGRPVTPNAQMKRRFVLLGEKLPEERELVHEINPQVRTEPFREAMELLLSLLSQQFGYGTRRYSFDPATRAVTTATQYIGERQDMLQELNRQRYEAREYIADIARAVLWFANAWQGAAWDLDAPVRVRFDDSFISDEGSELRAMREDIAQGIGGARVRRLYLMRRYHLDEEEAERWDAKE